MVRSSADFVTSPVGAVLVLSVAVGFLYERIATPAQLPASRMHSGHGRQDAPPHPPPPLRGVSRRICWTRLRRSPFVVGSGPGTAVSGMECHSRTVVRRDGGCYVSFRSRGA